MGIFSFLGTKKKQQQPTHAIALDIGTEVAKGLFFELTPAGTVIKASYYIKQPLEAMQAGRIINEKLVESTVSMVLDGLMRQVKDRPKNLPVILGIAGEMINGVAINANIERLRKPDMPIDPSEEKQLLSELFEQVATEGKAQLAEKTGIPEDKIMVLNITLTGGYIDGKPFKVLEGLQGRYLSASLYASFAPVQVTQGIFNIASRLGLDIKGIIVQPYAVASALAQDNIGFSGIIIDIGGGTTDIAVVNKGIDIQTQMIAFGGRAFTQRIAKEFSLSYNIAEEQKIKYSAGILESGLASRIREALQQDVRLWLDTVRTALAKIHVEDTYPEVIYLCGGGAMLPDLQDGILSYPWSKFLEFKHHPKLQIASVSKLDKIFDNTGQLNHPYDVTPAAIAHYMYELAKRPLYNYVGF